MHSVEKATELEIVLNKEKIKLRDALAKLKQVPEFKLLIEDKYLMAYASELVIQRSNPSKQSTEDQSLINKAIDGVGSFSHYLYKIESEGNLAESAIKDTEEYLEYLRNQPEED